MDVQGTEYSAEELPYVQLGGIPTPCNEHGLEIPLPCRIPLAI